MRARVTKHRETYLNFRLVNAFKVDNKLQIENAIKAHPVFMERIRSLLLNNKKFVELLHIEGISFCDLDKIFREIITSIEYSPANYVKILEENKALKKQINEIHETNNTHQLILVKADNDRLQIENSKLIRKYNTLNMRTKDQVDHSDLLQPAILAAPQPVLSGKVISSFKKNMRNKQGTYIIGGQEYKKMKARAKKSGTALHIKLPDSYKNTIYLSIRQAK